MATKKQEVYTDLEKNTLIENEFIHDWVFHYNCYTDEWAAMPREIYNDYWSNYKHPEVLRSKKLETLVSLLHKTKGDKKAIEKLTSGKRK